jgi:spermidine synthase
MTRFLAGFCSLLTALTLAREVSIAFGGNETTLALALAVWLANVAVGVRLGRRAGAPRARTILAAGAAAPLLLVLARGLDPVLGAWIPGDPQLGRLLLGCVLVLGPAGLAAGAWLYPAGDPSPAGGPWSGPIAGAAAGGLTASAIAAAGGPAFLAAMLVAAAAVLADGTSPGRRRVVTAAGLAAVVLVATVSPRLDRATIRWTHPDLVDVVETPRGRLVLDGRDGALDVHRDGSRLASSDDPGGAEMVHLAATQRDRLGRALLLGGWLEDLAAQLAPYAPDTVVSIEPAPRLIARASRVLRDRPPPHTVETTDPARWLRRTDERFDLILLALPDPRTVAAERNWTQQFFALCGSRLRDGGVLAMRLHTPEEVWPPHQARRVAAVRKALQATFPEVQVLPGITTVILAAPRPLDRDLDRMVGRLRPGPAAPDVVSAEWLRWRWRGDRTGEIGQLLEQSRVTATSALKPISSGDALLRDLGRLLPGLGWHGAPRAGRWLGPLVIGSAVLMLFLRRRRQSALAAVSGFAGYAAATLAVSLVMHHQVQTGTLARDLGLLVALLAIGRSAGRWLLPAGTEPVGRWRMPALLVSLSFGSFLITLGLFEGLPLLARAALLLGTGALTAAIATAAARDPGTRRRWLLAPEIGGAAVGAVVAALLLMPFSGLPATALTVAALAFPAAVAVWPLPGRLRPPASR